MCSYNWKILSKYQNNVPLSKQILKNRNITDIDEFLNPPPIKYYFEKFSLDFKKSLAISKKIILSSIKNNTPIIIYGDYDSDGVNATAIIYQTIKNELNYNNVTFFIPNRFSHGYGLSIKALDEILKNYPKGKKILFITVDTGITAIEEVDYLKKLGHQIIVTDHHQKLPNIPKCDALLWNDQVVGSMISWLLSKAIGSKNKNSLGLVAIATVTDLFPVVGINRSIINSGLKILNLNTPLGIKNLLKVSNKSGTISTYDLGWVIGPRLNAAGRLQDAKIAVDLILQNDDIKSFEIAKKLDQINQQRQDKTVNMYKLSNLDEQNLPFVIVQAHGEYHEGIIGLVASKFVQKHYRPTLVISTEGDVGKGSARSIEGINIIQSLRAFEDLFEDLGGHPMAAGFTIKTKNIPELNQKLNEHIKNNYDKNIFTPLLQIDMDIPLNIININLFDEIKGLEPFGVNNNEPVFCSKNVSVIDISLIGKNKDHVSFKLLDGDNLYKGIWFGAKDKINDIGLGDKVDVAYSMNKNDFNNKVSIDLMIMDLVLSSY